MPELPEVETIRRSLAPRLTGQAITQVIIRQPQLRWPISVELRAQLQGQTIQHLQRRAKYLLLYVETGVAIFHLGMSGRLRLLPSNTPLQKHDHVDLVLRNGHSLRFNDSRRFGVLLWTEAPPETHPLLCQLGPEPLSEAFSETYLYCRAQRRSVAIKNFIMNNRIVVGIGNIYANESLFAAGINPRRAAGQVTRAEYKRLAGAIRHVLEEAIDQGGTTLRDFTNVNGEAGYFKQALRVYGRAQMPCTACGTAIQQQRIGQRASYFCPHCQR